MPVACLAGKRFSKEFVKKRKRNQELHRDVETPCSHEEYPGERFQKRYRPRGKPGEHERRREKTEDAVKKGGGNDRTFSL